MSNQASKDWDLSTPSSTDPIDELSVRRAAMVCAHHAKDAGELRQFLAMLGLIEDAA